MLQDQASYIPSTPTCSCQTRAAPCAGTECLAQCICQACAHTRARMVGRGALRCCEDLQPHAAASCLAQTAALPGEPCGLLPAARPGRTNVAAHDRSIRISFLAGPCGASEPNISLSLLRPPQVLTWPDMSPASRDIFRPELSKWFLPSAWAPSLSCMKDPMQCLACGTLSTRISFQHAIQAAEPDWAGCAKARSEVLSAQGSGAKPRHARIRERFQPSPEEPRGVDMGLPHAGSPGAPCQPPQMGAAIGWSAGTGKLQQSLQQMSRRAGHRAVQHVALRNWMPQCLWQCLHAGGDQANRRSSFWCFVLMYC